MNKAFDELGAELDRESCEWLQTAAPLIFDALEVAIIRGASPEEARAFVLRRVGGERTGIANRVEAAARHLMGQKAV